MDIAYDHIQEEVLSPDEQARIEERHGEGNLSKELQDAYNTVASSPWGARLGGFLGSVKKQSESYYEGARQEYTAASAQATKGLTDLGSSILSRTRSLSSSKDAVAGDASTSFHTDSKSAETILENPERPESLRADIVKEAESMLSRLRLEAAKRLIDIETAEDVADEALMKFGTNIRNFLRGAVTVVAPLPSPFSGDSGRGSELLFESKDSEGKRVIHTTRLDAQLHALHLNLASFTQDPIDPAGDDSGEWDKWRAGFDVEARTDDMGRAIENYEELRRAMETLVPEKVDYSDFVRRYYFLRHVLDVKEEKRRDLLKGAATQPEEEVSWDADSEDDESSTPNREHAVKQSALTLTQPSSASHTQTPSQAPLQTDAPGRDLLTPNGQPRRSHDQHSQADSDASYDLVSGATSKTPGSPKATKTKDCEGERKADDSDEEDWE